MSKVFKYELNKKEFEQMKKSRSRFILCLEPNFKSVKILEFIDEDNKSVLGRIEVDSYFEYKKNDLQSIQKLSRFSQLAEMPAKDFIDYYKDQNSYTGWLISPNRMKYLD